MRKPEARVWRHVRRDGNARARVRRTLAVPCYEGPAVPLSSFGQHFLAAERDTRFISWTVDGGSCGAGGSEVCDRETKPLANKPGGPASIPPGTGAGLFSKLGIESVWFMEFPIR